MTKSVSPCLAVLDQIRGGKSAPASAALEHLCQHSEIFQRKHPFGQPRDLKKINIGAPQYLLQILPEPLHHHLRMRDINDRQSRDQFRLARREPPGNGCAPVMSDNMG